MISVIIPTLNEEQQVAKAISSAGQGSTKYEVIVVDGGSSDRTAAVAMAAGGRVLLSPVSQRAAQMNLGAKEAHGEVLLFLHADTFLPKGALDLIQAALRDGRVAGGAFARRFDSPSLFLKCTCLLAEVRSRALGWFLGDQAIFVCGSVFERLGGFRPMDRFEDLDLSRRLAAVGKVVTLRPWVRSSARRFAGEGPVGRTVRDFLLTLRYLQGESVATHDVPRPVGKHA